MDAHFAREWEAAQQQLLAYARWATGSREEAEDLVQAVAVRAWRGFAHFRGDAAFLTWTMAIARREAARAGARRQRLRTLEAPLPLDPPWAAEEADPATPGAAVGPAMGGLLAEAARAAHARGEVNATELAVLLARLHRPDSTWAQLGDELGLPASRCAVAHCRGVVKLRVALFLHHPELLGTPEELSAAAERAARRTRSEPLTPDEANLLLEACTGLGVPFLVIEPAKAEYRHLAAHPGLGGRLRVFGIGPQAPMPLRLNPFEPLEGTPLSRHLDLLKAVFNASFPMFAGMSYVLEDAMIEVYTERGWDLQYSVNDLLGHRPSAADRAALIPSVGDLYGKIEEVLDRRSYGREVHQNMGAALRSRLGSLLVGTKGMALDTRRGVPVTELFERPAVVELRGLGDDEEKSFVMALLLCMLYEHAEARSDTGAAPSGVGLRHLTLIEEAHRLLRASRGPSGGEVGDPQAKAVSMFTDMLAEMRAYGEGFVVADQVPVKLAPDVVKNSNVKILHRLVAADDRAVVSAAVNLTDRQSRHLGLLPPGVAVVHDERIGSAVLVAMREADEVVGAGGVQGSETDDGRPGAPAEANRHYLHRHGGCRRCPSPCTLLHRIDRPPSRRSADAALAPFFQGLVFGRAEELWEAWSVWRAEAPADGEEAYCAFAQAAQRHLATLPRRVPARAVPAGRAAAPAEPAPSGPTADETGRHLLARDRAARVLAQLCADWLATTELTEHAAARLEQARAEFVALVASRPDRELPGCTDCPARCRPFALLADSLPAYAAQVAAAADRPVPLESRLLLIDRLADEYAPAARGAMEKDRAALLYCMTVTANAYDRGLGAPPPTEALDALRSDRPVVP
ncbi:sigma factor [Streptomyces yangpuensis]|uniref:sigma factor n=1 Tax=Streptomyces yangpuensis TaxID=1648182 RepID=UPI0036826DCB